jgi:hypothetical protein
MRFLDNEWPDRKFIAQSVKESNVPGAPPSLSWPWDQGDFSHATKCALFIRTASLSGVTSGFWITAVASAVLGRGRSYRGVERYRSRASGDSGPSSVTVNFLPRGDRQQKAYFGRACEIEFKPLQSRLSFRLQCFLL